MKFLRNGLYLIILSIAAGGCHSTEKENLPSVFDVTVAQGPYTAATQEIGCVVECDMDWTAKMQKGSWVKVAPAKDNALTLSISFNNSEEVRKDTLLLRAGDATKKIGIAQEGLSSLISPREIVLNGTDPQTIRINAPGVWRLRLPGGVDWIVLSEKDGNAGPVEVSVSASEPFIGIDSRSAEVYFTSTIDQIQLSVKQLQTDAIEVPEDTFAFDFKGGSFEIETLYNVDFEMIVPEESSSWLRPSGGATKSLKSDKAAFTVAPNYSTEAHSAEILIKGAGIERVVTVTQSAADAVLDEELPGFYHIGGDWIFDRRKDQISRIYTGKEVVFGLYTPSGKHAAHLSGIPASGLAPGAEFPVTLVQNRDVSLPARQNLSAFVLKVSDGKVWLSTAEGPAFIVKL